MHLTRLFTGLLLGFTAVACAAPHVEPGVDGNRSPGKPRHPIQVELVESGNAAAGETAQARLRVRSTFELDALEVVLQPKLATVLSETRFLRAADELAGRRGAELAFRFTAADDEAQPVTVVVKATRSDGRVFSREVTLELAAPSGRGERAVKKPAADTVAPTGDGGDRILPAEQDVERRP